MRALAPQSHKATPAQVAANKYFRNIKVVYVILGDIKRGGQRRKGDKEAVRLRFFMNDAAADARACPHPPRRHRPNGADHPLQPDFPAQRPGQQPHHRRAGEEQAHEDRHQPLPAVAVRQRPDGLGGLHPLHAHPQPHAGLRLRCRDVQVGHVLHG